MKKILFLLPFLFIYSASFAQNEVDLRGPWMVCEIDVSGNKNIAKKTIIKAGQAKKGALYQRGFTQEDSKAILSTGNFEKAQVDVSLSKGTKKDKEDAAEYQCHKITFIVEEKPIFDKIEYEGRKKLSKHAITEAMTLKIKDPYNEIKLEGDMDRIKAKYAEKGYINTDVKFTTTLDDKQKIAIVKLIINEGVRTRVKDVVIEGADEIPAKKIIKQSKNRPGKVYKPQLMMEDYGKMTLYGRNKGFSEYDISKPEVTMNDDKTEISLKYEVKEGPKADFGETSFEGNTVFTDAELAKRLIYRPHKLYNQNDFSATVRDLQEQYANKGYLAAKITPERKIDDKGELNIKFDIQENNIFYVDHVDVSGFENTKKHVLAREITLKPGDRFDYSKIRRSEGKLVNLGFINDVQPEISPTNYPDRVDVDFHVQEGRPGMFTAGAAMSSLDGLYGEVSINHMNLFGRAQKISLRTMFGKNILDYTLRWSMPWTFDRPTSFGIDAFNTRRYRPYKYDSRAYTEKRIGGRINVGPRFEEDKYYLGLYYSLQNIDISDVVTQYQDEVLTGSTLISTFGANFAIDTRDNVWDPTTGWRNSIGIDISGGPLKGDLDDWTLSLRSVFNHTLFNIGGNYPVVFVLSNRFSSTKPYGSTKVLPTYEKYFIGGADTIRGYENTGQIGDPSGNEVFFIANAELRLPLAREGRRNIAQLALFLDAGNAWNSVEDVKLEFGPNQDQFKAGVGLGLRFATPQLPIRVDWGYGLNHRDGEDKTHFYFNMSNSF